MQTEDPNNKRGESPPRLSTGEFAWRVAIAVCITVLIAGLTVFVAFSIQTWFAVYLGILLAIFLRSLSDWLSATRGCRMDGLSWLCCWLWQASSGWPAGGWHTTDTGGGGITQPAVPIIPVPDPA
jgi:zinc transporter ZupT